MSSAKLVNVSSRLRVQTGDKALFAGFIITGSDSAQILLRAIAPSLKSGDDPVPGRMDDPTIELFDQDGNSVELNDNWKDSPNRAEIEASGFAPSDDRESVISRVVPAGNYSAIVRGAGNSTGIAAIEVYDRTSTGKHQFANISTRGQTESGDNILIGGFFVSSQSNGTRVVIRAIQPDIAGAIEDPTLELKNENGDTVVANDNWKDSPDRAEIESTGLQPTKDVESAIIFNVAPASYTALVRGANGTGIAVIEVYNVPRGTSGE